MRGGMMLVLLGGAALAYYYYSKGGFSSTPIPTTTGGGTPPPTPPANFNSLASIATRIQADVAANHEPSTLSVYQWNFYLARQYSGPQPDATAWTANNPSFDPSNPITFNAYWSGAAPWLTANAGLKGLSGGWLV